MHSRTHSTSSVGYNVRTRYSATKHEDSATLTRNQDASVTLEGNKIIKKILSYKEVTCSDLLTEEQMFAVGQTDGTVDLRNIETCHTIRTLDHHIEERQDMPVTCVSFSKKEHKYPLLLASYASGYSSLWNCSKSIVYWSIIERRESLANCWNPESTVFAVAGTDCKINIYDVEAQSLSQTLVSSGDFDIMDGHTMKIFDVKFHPNRRDQLISGGWDKTVHFWDLRSSHSIRKLDGPYICGNGLEFMHDGNLLLTASWSGENSLQVWDYDQGKLVEDLTPEQHVSFLYCCRYSALGNFVIAGGEYKNMFYIIEASRKVEIANCQNLPDPVLFVCDYSSTSSKDEVYRFHVGFGRCIYLMELDS